MEYAQKLTMILFVSIGFLNLDHPFSSFTHTAPILESITSSCLHLECYMALLWWLLSSVSQFNSTSKKAINNLALAHFDITVHSKIAAFKIWWIHFLWYKQIYERDAGSFVVSDYFESGAKWLIWASVVKP